MPTRVTITGTGNPQLTPDRAGPGVLVTHEDMCLQFDAGRATLSRLVAVDLTPHDLDVVFLTHYHSDHVIGLQDIVLSHWILDRQDDAATLEIVAPNGATIRHCTRMLEPWDDDLEVRAHHNERAPQPKIDIHGFDAAATPEIVWSRGEVRVLAGQVRHEPVVDAVGYRIETPDGVVAISGDTRVCDEVAALAEGADILVYESMRSDKVMERPPHLRYLLDYHADNTEIGRQAQELGIPTLMLTHMIPPPSDDAERQVFVDQVRAGGYTGDLIVCDDLDWREI